MLPDPAARVARRRPRLPRLRVPWNAAPRGPRLGATWRAAWCCGLWLAAAAAGERASAAEGEVWHEVPGGRWRALAPPADQRPGFALLAPARTGIQFTNVLPRARYLRSQILPNGSGVTAADVDGDGLCDLFFAGLRDGGNRLYRNLGGWRFADVTRAAGLARSGVDCTGAAFADLDGDGDPDLAVNSLGGGTRLFFNDGHGRFTAAAPLLNPDRGGSSLALADADGDGDLDLYLCNYRLQTLTDMPGTRFGVKMINGRPVVTRVNGRPLTDPQWTNRFRFRIRMAPGMRGHFSHEEFGEADVFLRNDGRGHFQRVSFTGGNFLDEAGQPLAQPPFDWGLSVLFRDLTGDGAPDLYVCNDFDTPDRFWINDGTGRFRLAPRHTLRQTSQASMALDAADLDRDGRDDFLVLDMLSPRHGRRLLQRNLPRPEVAPSGDPDARPQYSRNTLFWNRGDGTWAEAAQYAGLEATDWSWNALFLDVDLDGYEDLLVPNGFIRDNNHLDVLRRIDEIKAARRLSPDEELGLRALYPVLNTPNLAFRNLGRLRFTEVTEEWGFDQAVISQGACLADLDNDGDLDVALNNLNAAAGIYENRAPGTRITVRLRGRPPNTAGIGARIRVQAGGLLQQQQVVCGGRYCSSDQPQRTFAVPGGGTVEVRVRWRSGQETVLTEAPANTLVEVVEPAAGGNRPVAQAGSPHDRGDRGAGKVDGFRFADYSGRLGHRHEERLFNDFERQPLLPRKLSQLGPGVAWWDLDGDGREDLLIGGGAAGYLAAFRNTGAGRFARLRGLPWERRLARDLAGFAGWAPGECLAALANYEDPAPGRAGILRIRRGAAGELTSVAGASPGPLAVGDFDSDGDLDLFVGARVVGGRYPAPARSTLFRQEAGRLGPVAEDELPLAPGLVAGAVWSDLEGDGRPELVLAHDWGPLRIYRRAADRWAAWDPPVTLEPRASDGKPPARLSDLTGWWSGVTAGDFDNDGRLDLVAGNWGANSHYERWRPAPLRVDFGDFNEDGVFDFLESHFAPELKAFAPARRLDEVLSSLPQLTERFPTHAAWARATLDTVLADWRDRARHAEVRWLESTLFLNRGDHFRVRPLPWLAQLTPVFALCVADVDGDGNEDLFLSQNFFDMDQETSRQDAGRGLWLRGDGRGGLTPVPGQASGVRIHGQQRGAAVADFDADGRPDLVVTQNRGATRLFHNEAGRPGLRVRLHGPEGNPFGLGAVLRLDFGDARGPAREIHGGGGYWSQDSPVVVLALPRPPKALEVRWPGGRLTRHPIPAGTRELTVNFPGPTRQ